MGRFGLCGPSYKSQSPVADLEKCLNWYPEPMESLGKSAFVLYPTPGTKIFTEIKNRTRGNFSDPGSGRRFAVGGDTFYEILPNGTAHAYGTVLDDGLPCSFAMNQASPAQLALTSGGVLYIFNLGTLTLAPQVLLGSPILVKFCGGYFLAVLADGRFQVSALLDGTSWPGLQVIQVSVFAEPVIGMEVDHGQVWVFGANHAQLYYNSGTTSIFDPTGPTDLLELGINAPTSLVKIDNTIAWLDNSERGALIARKLGGSTPTRISNHGVEYQWSTYPKCTDVVGYAMQDQGHSFLCWYFPSANGGLGATWCYDVETGGWHERGYWDAINGNYTAHRSWNHSYSRTLGQHLVGDWNSGKLYDLSINNLDDDGSPIRRMRIAPPIATQGGSRSFHNRLTIDVETGLGPMPWLTDGLGNPRGPQLLLDWTDTAGKSWSNQFMLDCGQQGEYRKRVYKLALGSFLKQRSYRIIATDPIPWRIIDGDLLGTGFAAAARSATEYAKVT